MDAKYREALGVPEDANIERISSENKMRKGQDVDIFFYDEKDAEGNVIATYEIHESTSIYPPQKLSVFYYKRSPNGNQIASGPLPNPY
ncbi:hypothetical protein [Chromobacterium violaceum]|uniref:hypothetical protein n=1 Tax=Chromobacterium violaceum TaxID=536 RepID=UPI0012D346BC|nr:hypothetical protein [Chromobacterium violaceum]